MVSSKIDGEPSLDFNLIMPSGSKNIKARIRAVRNIRKITKAMELVSAAKMRRAVGATLASRPYAAASLTVLNDLAAVVDPSSHPYLFASGGAASRVLILVMTPDRGLCGNLTVEIFRRADEFALTLAGQVERIDYAVIGKKGAERMGRRGLNLVASFSKLSVIPTPDEFQPIALFITKGFLEKQYDRVFLIYTDFISSLARRATVHQLLPLTYSAELGAVSRRADEAADGASRRAFAFVFEPGRDAVLSAILPRLIETQLYQAMLESCASEHSSRMVAMKNASDSAADIADDLALAFNQMRQASITREIAEISAGKAVLE